MQCVRVGLLYLMFPSPSPQPCAVPAPSGEAFLQWTGRYRQQLALVDNDETQLLELDKGSGQPPVEGEQTGLLHLPG